MVQKGRLRLKERRSVQCTAAGVEGTAVMSVYHFHYKGMIMSRCDKKMNFRRKGVIIAST